MLEEDAQRRYWEQEAEWVRAVDAAEIKRPQELDAERMLLEDAEAHAGTETARKYLHEEAERKSSQEGRSWSVLRESMQSTLAWRRKQRRRLPRGSRG